MKKTNKKSTPIQMIAIYLMLIGLGIAELALGQASLPGSNQFDRLTAAGDLLKTIDVAIFTYAARLLAGLAVLGSGWSLKEHKFGLAVIGVLSAIMLATVPMWVQNVFDIGGGSIFTN